MDDLEVHIRRLANVEDTHQTYCCMTEVPTPWPQALCQCRDWVAQHLGRHVEGYHLRLGSGEVVGHLYYALSEHALIPYEVEAGVGVMYCEWVQRRYQHHGLGQRLFGAFVDEMRQQDAKGILVEGTDREDQMHVRHYQARGFEVIHHSGHYKLLYLPLTQAQVRVRPLQPRIQPRRRVPVEILIVRGYMCPFEIATLVLLQEVSREFGDRVVVRQVELTPETLAEYGVATGIFINGRLKLGGAETEESVRQAIFEEL
jgi:GNAT superfamily N-acetyltransferase